MNPRPPSLIAETIGAAILLAGCLALYCFGDTIIAGMVSMFTK